MSIVPKISHAWFITPNNYYGLFNKLVRNLPFSKVIKVLFINNNIKLGKNMVKNKNSYRSQDPTSINLGKNIFSNKYNNRSQDQSIVNKFIWDDNNNKNHGAIDNNSKLYGKQNHEDQD